MKFACDSCGAQYMIADEKIGKAGVKVRCKKCSHVIVVRRPAEEDTDHATVVMDNPLSGMETAEAPAFTDDSADMEIGAAFDSIFGDEEAGTDQVRQPEPEASQKQPDDPFAAAVDNAFDAALDGGPVAHEEPDDSSELDSTRVFTSEDMRRVAEEREHASHSPFADEEEPRAEPEPEPEDAGEDAARQWYIAIEDEQIGPLTVEEVQGHWESGDLSPDSLVWQQSFSDWEPLSSVDELKHLIAPTPALGGPEKQVGADEQAGKAGEAGGIDEPSAKPEEPEEAPEWKPGAASLLASLAADEMSALERESEEGSELAGPTADPVAEAAEEAPSTSAGYGLDLPPPPAQSQEEEPADDPAPPPPADFAPAPQEQRTPTPAPVATPAAAAPPSYPTPPPASVQQQPQGHFGAPHAPQPPMGGQAQAYGGYGAGPLTAAPPPPAGMSRKMMLAIGGGGAGVSALLVVLILVVTGVIGGDQPDPAAEALQPVDDVAEVPVQDPEDEPEAGEDEDQKDEEAKAQDDEDEEQEKKAEGDEDEAEGADEQDEAEAAKREASKQQAKATPTRRPQRRPQTTTKRTTTRTQKSRPSQQKQRPSSPPPAPTKSEPDEEEDLAEQLFGPSGGGGGSSSGAQASREERGSSSRGYIPAAAGSGRDRDLPREVSRGDIVQVVSSKRGDLRQCVSRQRAADPDAGGTVVMAWRIQPDGTPSGIRVASAEHRGSVIGQCLTQVVRSMRFPRYGGPQMDEIEFPFDF